MIELSLSAFAWAGVVLFQAMVHYTVRTQQKRGAMHGQPALEASPLVLEMDDRSARDSDAEARPSGAVPDDAAMEEELFRDEIDPLDGDEPAVFFELLSQTGCEMMRNVSIESIVLEQMHEDDRSRPSGRVVIAPA